MPRKKTRRKRNYAKEARWAATPIQKKRRADRNRARRQAIKKYGKAALRGKEVDHVGSHRTGRLKNVRTRVISRAANRRKQPKRGGRKRR